MRNIVLVVLAAVFASSCGFEIVDTGYRGIEIRLGRVVSGPLPEGLYFYNPFTSNIIEMDIREQKTEGKTEAYTKDVQQVVVHFAVNYRPDPNTVHDLYREVGVDWVNKLLGQVITGQLKNSIGQYDAVHLVANRPLAVAAALKAIQDAATARRINVTRLELTDLTFTEQFEHATEAKVAAQQEAAKAENITKRIEQEAKQRVISAEAEARSMTIRAQALSQNKGLVEWEAVQKWDGKLPQYMLGGSVPFIDMTPKRGIAQPGK